MTFGAVSPYALVGPRLVEMGYSAIPIIPGSKAPGTRRGDELVALTEWRTRFNRKLPSQFEMSSWSKDEAGVGVVCGYNDLVAIDIDIQDRIIFAAIVGVLPETEIRKTGFKGETLFFRGRGIPSQSFDILGPGDRLVRAVDIIADGRQTLLPPTIHPDTGRPYCWTGLWGLEEVEPHTLPELPSDIVARIEAALLPFGSAARKKPDLRVVDVDETNPFRAVNNLALANLDAWVPRLPLYRLRDTRDGYEAVATWRSSSSGKPLEQRRRNLKIHPSGIRDFGAANGNHTPIDLFMLATDCDVDTAFRSLAEATGWSTGEVVEVRSSTSPGPGAAGDDQPKPLPDLVFGYGHRQVEPPPWLVEGILPEKELAIVAGQSTAGKTFVGIDLSFCVATGHDFIGHKIARPGAVLWLAAEGFAEVMIRMKATALFRTGETMERKIPFYQQAYDVPSLSDRSAEAKLMALIEATKAHLHHDHAGVDLVLVVIDTLNGAAEFRDENSASETQRVMNMLRGLSGKVGALVLMIDHFGKTGDAGVRGSSAKTGAADAILSVRVDRVENASEARRVTVEKLRGAPTGLTVAFALQPVDIGDGKTHCAIRWSAEKTREFTVKSADKTAWTKELAVLKKSIVACASRAQNIQVAAPTPYQVKAVSKEEVREHFYLFNADDNSATKRQRFLRNLKAAQIRGLLGSQEIDGVDWLWIANDVGL